jgi:mono/diheme cytochrome c family protein
MKRSTLIILVISILLVFPISAQDDVSPDCLPENLAQQQSTFAEFLTPDFEGDSEQAIANLFRLGAAYQEMALRCGYVPNEPEVNTLIDQVLEFASLESLIQAQSVGDDVEEILLELEEVGGDPLTGQELYNGLEPALGGAILGCSGCHEVGEIAPPTEGTWTRVNDIRLLLPEFEEYTVEQYLVESIVNPAAYQVPDYTSPMPAIYSNQLTIQQLADLVAYLDSQDQLLDDE